MKLRMVKGIVGMVSILMVQGCIIDQIGGAFKHAPEEMDQQMSKGARALVDQAYDGLSPDDIVDLHVHIIGLDADNRQTWVNPRKLSWRHPFERFRTAVFMSASGISDFNQADAQYLARLVRLIRADKRHGRYLLLALDHYYRPDGTLDMERSEFYTANERVFELTQKYPDIFQPAVSVHPYRPDALEELEKWGRKGVHWVKWLPNAQGIDASQSRCDAYYRMMKTYNMVLLTHTGMEAAVNSKENQALGNPLLFRRPLDMGVKVIMAHAAAQGEDCDLDDPQKKKVDSFSLFMRLMDEPHYEGVLFGEISAITQFNRLPGPLATLLKRRDLHHRLVNGSDYPMPALNIIVHTGKLAQYGFITAEEGHLLSEIYDYNPLLFDFVLKRTVHLPDSDQHFASSVFTLPDALRLIAPSRP